MLNDARLALRSLVVRPAFTALAVLALALGTGANTLVFSVVNAVLLRPLPYADADRLYVIHSRGPAAEAADEGLSAPDLTEIQAASTAFASIGGIVFTSFDLSGTAEPQQLRAGRVTDGLLASLAVRPLVGRLFSPGELAEGAPLVVLDETVWRSQFNADPGIAGRVVTLDGRPFTVIGVLPHLTFRYGQEYEIWTTIPPKELAAMPRNARGGTTFARLRPGVTEAAAREELGVIARRLAAQYPKENGGWRFDIEPVRAWHAAALRPALLVLVGAVTLVLLIACINVAHMLLARASQRQREIAIRTALGATRGRIVRQLLAESLTLALAGTACGVAIAALCLPVLLRVAPLDPDQRALVVLDGRVLVVSLLVAAATGLVFGLWPALVTSRGDVQGVIKSEAGHGATGRGGTRARGLLVVSEVAFASVLLAGAGLLLKSFDGLVRIDRGYDPTLVVTTGLVLPGNVYKKDDAKREFVRDVLERLRATPGVSVAAVVNFLPRFGAVQGTIDVPGRTDNAAREARQASWRVATPDYFRALRIPVLNGRGFDDHDQPGGLKVAVINQTLAARFFPGENPVGRDLRLAAFGPPTTFRVVGVIRDVRHGGRTQATEADIFLPFAQNPWAYMNLVVRGRQTTPTALKAAINRAVLAVDPARPTFGQMTLEESAEGDLAQPRFGAALMSAFAVVAAVLACVGIFGVMAYAVASRTREIGIRVALGGQPAQVLRLVLRPGLALVAIGTAAGVIAALAGGRVLASQLYGVAPSDPPVLAAVALLVAAVGAAACYLPARRVTRVSPVIALRSE